MNMGNGFPINGFLNPMNIFGGNAGNDSSSASDDSSFSENDDEVVVDSNLDSKVLNSSKQWTTRFSSDLKIALETVRKIEKDLDLNDFVSLVFLLYDGETEIALQTLYTLVNSGPTQFSRDVLSKWALDKRGKWSLMLIEALTVTQNYKVLRKLGYNKDEVDHHFFPRTDTALKLNRIKKKLYIVCECLSIHQAEDLIEKVRQDIRFENDITVNCDPVYLEFHILFWISRGYLKIDQEVCLKNLTKHLKLMGLLDKVSDIESMIRSIDNEKKNKTPQTKFDSDDLFYDIKNPLKPGLVIVINQDKFTRDRRKQFQDQLPPEELKDREGSLVDVKTVAETFQHFMFKVVEEHNIPHDKLEEEIQRIIIDHFEIGVHSILILCVLSHGCEGKVYASNSIPVSIKQIQDTISGDSMIGISLAKIPKVIIIQACQGIKQLLVDQESSKLNVPDGRGASGPMESDGGQVTFDGPEKIIPKHADVLTCMAIIPGFVAVRSTKEGTKYIQELCRCIKKFYKKEHLLDIILKVHHKLNNEAMHVTMKYIPEGMSRCPEHSNCLCVYMTPIYYSSQCKKLYLVKR